MYGYLVPFTVRYLSIFSKRHEELAVSASAKCSPISLFNSLIAEEPGLTINRSVAVYVGV